MGLLALILLAGFASIILVYITLLPIFSTRYGEMQTERARSAGQSLENMFVWITHKKLIFIFALSPAITGVILYFLFGNKYLIVAGAAAGFILPMLVIRQIERRRRAKFQAQLIDAMHSISQSLKAGLSFLQSLEVLVEEMPPPISQEFGLILKENKMGVPIERSFEDLNKKMNIEELNLMTTAILVARETGGNLTDLLSNLSEVLRQKYKLADQVKTLTVQARLQGLIMSCLPVVFAIFVYKMNPGFFDVMFESEKGKMLMAWCVISEVVGAFLLMQLSKVEV